MPASTTPPEQVLIAARKELPNAPEALFDSLSRETDKRPWGIHSFVTNGTRELHKVYVYVLDISHLTHWSEPCAWVDSARPADGGWVPGTVEMRSLTTFEQAAEHSYFYWRSCYLRGLIYAWEKHLSDQPKPEPILPKELSAPSPLPSPPSSPKLVPNPDLSVGVTMPTTESNVPYAYKGPEMNDAFSWAVWANEADEDCDEPPKVGAYWNSALMEEIRARSRPTVESSRNGARRRSGRARRGSVRGRRQLRRPLPRRFGIV